MENESAVEKGECLLVSDGDSTIEKGVGSLAISDNPEFDRGRDLNNNDVQNSATETRAVLHSDNHVFRDDAVKPC